MLDDYEYWLEEIRYRGRGTWQIRARGANSSGRPQGEPVLENLNTKTLVDWTFDWDANDSEFIVDPGDKERLVAKIDSVDDASDPPRKLGNRGQRLLVIAKTEGAKKCQRLLEAWLEEKWPKLPKAPRITAVTGVIATYAARGAPGHPAYSVNTSDGPAILYPPNKGVATLVFNCQSHPRDRFDIRVTRRLAQEIAYHEGALVSLGMSLTGGNQK